MATGRIGVKVSSRYLLLRSVGKTGPVVASCRSQLFCPVVSRYFAMSSSTPRPLVVAGPSGSGKSTLLKKLFAEFPDAFGFSVSHTTRGMRPGEVDGKSYHFTTREAMQKAIDAGEFIESAEFSGNMYGTSKQAVSDVLAKGVICVLDIDMQGVRSVKKTELNPVYVCVRPPSMEVLEERLRKRLTETEESLKARLSAASAELDYASQPGVFDHTIVNDNLDEAYAQLRSVVADAVAALKGSQ